MFQLLFSAHCSWHVFQYLNFMEIVAFALCSKLGFRAACKIRYLTVFQPTKLSKENKMILFNMFTIISKARYLTSVEFTGFSNWKKSLFLIQLPENLQFIRVTNCEFDRNELDLLFQRWKKTKKELKYVESVDISNNCFNKRVTGLLAIWLAKKKMEFIFDSMCSLFPSLRTVCVCNPFVSGSIEEKESVGHIQNKYGVRIDFVDPVPKKSSGEPIHMQVYRRTWNVLMLPVLFNP